MPPLHRDRPWMTWHPQWCLIIFPLITMFSIGSLYPSSSPFPSSPWVFRSASLDQAVMTPPRNFFDDESIYILLYPYKTSLILIIQNNKKLLLLVTNPIKSSHGWYAVNLPVDYLKMRICSLATSWLVDWCGCPIPFFSACNLVFDLMLRRLWMFTLLAIFNLFDLVYKTNSTKWSLRYFLCHSANFL